MTKIKNTYTKGLKLFHLETKEKIIFMKWLDSNRASCLTESKMFLTLTKEELDNNYQSYAALEKHARDTRRGQCW
jgi:hypothetical protein